MSDIKDTSNVSDLFPKLHPANIGQLKSAIRFAPAENATQGFSGGVYFHGDGNMYFKKHLSDDRLIFHNDHPDNYGAGFRMFFNKTTAVPADLPALEKALVAGMNQEKKDNTSTQAMRTTSNPNALPRDEEEVAAPDVKAAPAPVAKADDAKKAPDAKADDAKK